MEIIQVTFSNLMDQASLKRECRGLVETAKLYGLKSGLLITDDRRDEIHQEGLKISLIPLMSKHIDISVSGF